MGLATRPHRSRPRATTARHSTKMYHYRAIRLWHHACEPVYPAPSATFAPIGTEATTIVIDRRGHVLLVATTPDTRTLTTGQDQRHNHGQMGPSFSMTSQRWRAFIRLIGYLVTSITSATRCVCMLRAFLSPVRSLTSWTRGQNHSRQRAHNENTMAFERDRCAYRAR
jgi:hypothetical protein